VNENFGSRKAIFGSQTSETKCSIGLSTAAAAAAAAATTTTTTTTTPV